LPAGWNNNRKEAGGRHTIFIKHSAGDPVFSGSFAFGDSIPGKNQQISN
jgi:hypothetical protein